MLVVNCPSCQAQVQSRWKVCPECGARLPPKKTCAGCGAEMQPQWKACPDCGQAISEGGVSATIKDSVVKEIHQTYVTENRQGGGAVMNVVIGHGHAQGSSAEIEYEEQVMLILQVGGDLARAKPKLEELRRRLGLSLRISGEIEAACVRAASPAETVPVISTPASGTSPCQPKPKKPWENSLGMKFVPVPGSTVLFSIWETRVQDYQAFVNATAREWEKPDFAQGPTHPAVMVSWEDAVAFCEWLTEKERREAKLEGESRYRLPTDAEWSVAVGLPPESGGTPQEKSSQIKEVYPWGRGWPPPRGAGNYDPSLKVDDFDETSAVGSFAADRNGLYDFGGNVWEWCEGNYGSVLDVRIQRGGSWRDDNKDWLLSSFRGFDLPSSRRVSVGFRCVLAVSRP